MPAKEELDQGFRIGDWEVLPGQGTLRRGDREERPEPKVFAVLMALAERDGNLVTRDDLVNEVWDGRPTSDEPINRCLSRLRSHLDDRERPHRYIETLQRRGYRLVQPVELEVEKAAADAATGGPSLRIWKIVAGVMALGFLLTVALMMRPPGPDAGVRSIAILPIENLSGEAGNDYIAAGIKHVLAQRLAEIPDLDIKNLRRNYDEEPSEIADRVKVDSVLTGAVQLQDRTLKVTYLISRGRDNVTIGSGEVNGELDNFFALQQRLASVVRDELTGTSTPTLITQHTPDSQAYDSFLRGMYAFEHRGEEGKLENAIQLFQESIGKDEYFGPAYLSLATAYALLPRYRSLPVEQSSLAAIQTVEKGIAVDGTIEDAASAVYGSVYHQQKRWLESEAAYQRAVAARVVDSNAFNWYSRMLASVGRLDDSLTQALAAAAIDPDNLVINSRVAIAYTWLGDSANAFDYFERASDLGSAGTTHLLAYALLLSRDGRFDEARDAATTATRMSGIEAHWVDPVFDAFEDSALTGEALLALDRAAQQGTLAPAVEVTTRTILGDVDGAMAVARRLQGVGEIFEMDLLYIPELQPLRDHPEFMGLLDRLGVVGYWEEARCSWDGQQVRCRDE